MPIDAYTRALGDSVRRVHGGNVKDAETLLMSQAVALDAIINKMARRAALHMGICLRRGAGRAATSSRRPLLVHHC
jgi:hypothetical protein